MAAVALIGVPHALCAAHLFEQAVAQQDHATAACEHCSDHSGKPASDHSDDDSCPFCEVGHQPYLTSAKANISDGSHLMSHWTPLPALPVASLAEKTVPPVDSAEPMLLGLVLVPGSSCALTILLGHLLL